MTHVTSGDAFCHGLKVRFASYYKCCAYNAADCPVDSRLVAELFHFSKELRNEDFVVLGEFCAKIIT